MLKNPDTSYSTIRSTQLSSGSLISLRRAWKEIQNSCPEIQRAIGPITAGTVPSRKRIKKGEKEMVRREVIELVRKGSISEDGLLVVKENFPMEIKHTETIVIPRDFATSVVTLIHNDPVNNHPTMNQMMEITKRRFYIFRRKEIIQSSRELPRLCSTKKNEILIK